MRYGVGWPGSGAYPSYSGYGCGGGPPSKVGTAVARVPPLQLYDPHPRPAGRRRPPQRPVLHFVEPLHHNGRGLTGRWRAAAGPPEVLWPLPPRRPAPVSPPPPPCGYMQSGRAPCVAWWHYTCARRAGVRWACARGPPAAHGPFGEVVGRAHRRPPQPSCRHPAEGSPAAAPQGQQTAGKGGPVRAKLRAEAAERVRCVPRCVCGGVEASPRGAGRMCGGAPAVGGAQ
jgi:hypothetical protein